MRAHVCQSPVDLCKMSMNRMNALHVPPSALYRTLGQRWKHRAAAKPMDDDADDAAEQFKTIQQLKDYYERRLEISAKDLDTGHESKHLKTKKEELTFEERCQQAHQVSLKSACIRERPPEDASQKSSPNKEAQKEERKEQEKSSKAFPLSLKGIGERLQKIEHDWGYPGPHSEADQIRREAEYHCEHDEDSICKKK